MEIKRIDILHEEVEKTSIFTNEKYYLVTLLLIFIYKNYLLLSNLKMQWFFAKEFLIRGFLHVSPPIMD